MNGEIPSIPPITTLAGISSLTDLLPEMPLPSPLSHTLSNNSLLFHPRVAEEANNLLNLRDENLVPLLTNSLLQTTSEHIELKNHYACNDQLLDHQYQPELLKAIVQRNSSIFKNTTVSQRMWHVQRQNQQQHLQPQQQQQQQILLQHQMHQQSQQNMPSQQQSRNVQSHQLQKQQYQSMHHHHQKTSVEQNTHQQQRHLSSQSNLLQQSSPQQNFVQQSHQNFQPQQQQSQQMQSPHQQIQSPHQQMQSPQPIHSPHQQMQQYHSQVRHVQQQQMQMQSQQLQQQQKIQSQQHLQTMQHSHQSSSVNAGSAASNSYVKGPSIASNYNNPTSVDYVSDVMNPFSSSMTSRPMQVNTASNRLPNTSNYSDSVPSSVSSPYSQQHNNYVPSSSIHSGNSGSNSNAGNKTQAYNNTDTVNNSSNYGYGTATVQNASINQSPLLPSLPTPTPTPSPTPTQSPTRYLRATVITSDTAQSNGIYSLAGVDKYLIGEDINLNMADQSMNVSNLNSPVLLQSSVDYQNQNKNMMNIASIIDPATNQPIHLSPQLQSQIESQLQIDAQSNLNSQEVYPADMLESTFNTSGITTNNLLVNDVSSGIPIISGDLSMTPPLSSSVSQLDSVPTIQGISPSSGYDLLENVTPILEENEQDALFNKLREPKKEPVIKLYRLTDQELKQNQSFPHTSNSESTTPNRRASRSNNEFAMSDYHKNASFSKNRNKELESQKQKSDYEIFSAESSKRNRSSRRSETPIKEEEEYIPKPKLKKIERKLVPVIEKLSVEELMETNTYQKFNHSIDKVFENIDDMDLSLEVESDDEIPEETLLPKYQLLDLCSEAAKLKSLSCMESIPSDRLIRLLGILDKNIRSGMKVSPIADEDDDECQRKLWMDTAMERVTRAVDASLIALYILTAPNMTKKVYLEDVIDRIILFTKYQLQNTIYPAYDPVYRIKQKKDVNTRIKKRPAQKAVRDKNLILLYSKIVEVTSLLAELLNIQPLTDNSILHLSTMGIGPFFVEGINELQLNALKLVTSIFMKYEKHRKLLLDDILASMARLPSSKQSLRSYRLSSQEHIQILTALVLQLIQCMVVLPKHAASKRLSWDADIEISRKFKIAQNSASNFLLVFLSKCSSKAEEIDYRPVFENFIQDLLTTVNKPEWPVAELMLSVLGKLLVTNFVNKGIEMPLRVASLDYLGVVAARLRKDSVTSHLKISTIDSIIRDIRSEEIKDEENPAKYDSLEVQNDEERTLFLQRVLLDYLAVKSLSDESLAYTRHFYICQWYHDALVEGNTQSPSKTNKIVKQKKKSKKKWKDDTSDEESEVTPDEEEQEKEKEIKNIVNEKLEHRKQFLLSKINPFDVAEMGRTSKSFQSDVVHHTYIDYESAELVSRYLSSKRPFSKSFETYLKHIIKVLMESSVLIRTKAMKCLTMIVEADPSVLALKEMQMGVCHSFLDHSTSVREAAVDLVGKFVLNQPCLIDNYYEMLSERILDTGVSVRKRVIKILKDICTEYPEYPKIPEICVKMIRRVNDEDGIRKLVMEVFQNMWFTPVQEKEQQHNSALQQKVMHITDVVSACKDMGLEWFEQLLVSLFKPKEDKEDSTKVVTEPPKILIKACKQIVDCLVDNVITLDGRGGNAPQRLVACVTTLYLFAKIRPQLLVEHAITLQPYLSLKCQTQGDYQIISCVARILEIVVPMLEHASEMFLSQLEEDSVKLIFQHDQTVILSCISCLGSVVNNVTRNFTLIRDCFLQYFSPLQKLKSMLENGGNPSILNNNNIRVNFRRSMYIVGLMLRFFDFNNYVVRQDKLPSNICNEVFDTLTFFMHIEDKDSQLFALRSVGSMCIRHYDYMLGAELMAHYQMILRGEDTPVPMKVQVLNNIKAYLQEEEKRMIKQDEEWAVLSKQENLKEMGDVSSGMASTIIQLYLKDILEAFLHPSSVVRQVVLSVIQLVLSQGLVHPVQIVPYLICMSTDEDKSISTCADKQLQDIEKKHPGFIHMKAQTGIKLSFKLQKIIQGIKLARGFRVKEGELPTALNGFLYSILRSKQQRRALVKSILKQFEEQVKTSLAQMLYLADNIAYFPYQVLDEPLFIIHHINIMISVTGTNLLQSFKEALLPNPDMKQGQDQNVNILDEDDDEDEESLLQRVPEDTTALQECITASQGCLMLLVLKQHLKTLYGFTDSKIALYSPSESAKIYEKSLNRKNNSKFHPKAALQKLQEDTPFQSTLDEKAKRELIAEYLEFKQLIISLDREDDDDDINTSKSQYVVKLNNSAYSGSKAIDGPSHQVKNQVDHESAPPSSGYIANSTYTVQASPNTTNTTNLNVSISNNSYNSQTPARIPKLTIVPPKPPPESSKHSHSHSHRSHKSKKSDRHKKHHHKRKKKSYKSDESDDADNDPDYSV